MQYLSLLKSSFTERTVKMINPAWLVQLVGLRIVDKVADPKRSDLEVISALAEEGISHIEASIPHQRMISKRSINAWAEERGTLFLTSSNPGGVSTGFSLSGRSVNHPGITIEDWLNSTAFSLAEFPMNYREDGSILAINRLDREDTNRLMSFLGVRGLLSISTQDRYKPSIIERLQRGMTGAKRASGRTKVVDSSSDDIPLGGRTSFQMPTFWTDWALKLCQEEALRSTAIWTSALKELPEMASAVVWEKMNPRLTILQGVAREMGYALEFAVTDNEFLRHVIGTPDYSRMGYDSLRNTVTRVPVGFWGHTLNGATGSATRGRQEHHFVMANSPRIFSELHNGCLISEGVIDEGLLRETFKSPRNLSQESFFIFRSLELELWLKRRV